MLVVYSNKGTPFIGEKINRYEELSENRLGVVMINISNGMYIATHF